jgi:DNA polymerase III gamma/tau subunit
MSIPEGPLAAIREHARRTEAARVMRAVEILIETESRLRFALSRRILLEMALLRCARVATVVSIDEILKRHGITPTVMMESASTPIIKRFAANGVGVAILSQQVVAKELQEGLLRLVPFRDAEVAYHFYLIRHRDRWASRSVKAFIDMAQVFQQEAQLPRSRRPGRPPTGLTPASA